MRYFFYSVVIKDYPGQSWYENFYITSKTFPTQKVLKDYVHKKLNTSNDMAVLSICEMSEKDYKESIK